MQAVGKNPVHAVHIVIGLTVDQAKFLDQLTQRLVPFPDARAVLIVTLAAQAAHDHHGVRAGIRKLLQIGAVIVQEGIERRARVEIVDAVGHGHKIRVQGNNVLLHGVLGRRKMLVLGAHLRAADAAVGRVELETLRR